MTPTPNAPGSRPAAVPVNGPPTRRKWLLPLLLGLLAVIALLLLLSQCGDDDDPEESAAQAPRATATASAAASSGAGSASPGAGGTGQNGATEPAPGTVTASGVTLLGTRIGTNLSAQNGRPAVGRAVRVQSVPADEGFWVGPSEENRLWVQLTGTGGESGYKVKQGDAIDFTGVVTPAAQGFADSVGVSAAEGAGLLTSQATYLSVPSSSVTLSR